MSRQNLNMFKYVALYKSEENQRRPTLPGARFAPHGSHRSHHPHRSHLLRSHFECDAFANMPLYCLPCGSYNHMHTKEKERERERQGKRARERERLRLRGSDQELSTTDGSIHCPHINNTDVSPKTHMILPSQNPTVPAATRIAEERRRQIDEERDRKRNKPQGSGNYQGKHLNHMSCVFRKAINFTLNMHDIHGIEVRWQDQLNPDGRGCSAPNITLSG